MLCELLLNEALLMYLFGFIALLVLLIVLGHLQDRTRNYKISRISLCKCKNCGLVFVISRFNKQRSVPCPRCTQSNSCEKKDLSRR